MKKWIKAKKVLNILLGSSVGIYVGMVLWRVLDYLMNRIDICPIRHLGTHQLL